MTLVHLPSPEVVHKQIHPGKKQSKEQNKRYQKRARQLGGRAGHIHLGTALSLAHCKVVTDRSDVLLYNALKHGTVGHTEALTDTAT